MQYWKHNDGLLQLNQGLCLNVMDLLLFRSIWKTQTQRGSRPRSRRCLTFHVRSVYGCVDNACSTPPLCGFQRGFGDEVDRERVGEQLLCLVDRVHLQPYHHLWRWNNLIKGTFSLSTQRLRCRIHCTASLYITKGAVGYDRSLSLHHWNRIT